MSDEPLDLTFRLFSTPVRISAWFWLLPSIGGGFIASILGVPYFFLAVGCIFLSVLLHEFGHVFAGHWFGRDSYVVLTGFGGVAIGCAEAFERWQRIVVYAAGAAIQLLGAGVLWGTNYLLLQRFPSIKVDHPFVMHALMALQWMNVCMAVLSMVPLWPLLDGGHICRELFGFFMERSRPPWEQDPDGWKRGRLHSDYSGPGNPELYGTESNRLPLLILIGAAGLLLGWHTFRDYQIATATDLMREFKKD